MKTNRALTLIILLLISSISYSQTNLVNGTAHLIGQTNNDSIMVVFERTAPGTTYDTCYTDVNGDYSKSIADGTRMSLNAGVRNVSSTKSLHRVSY